MPSKKRVLQVITLAEPGGAQSHVASLTGGLITHGYDVTVLVGRGDDLLHKVRQAGARGLFCRHLVREVHPWEDFLALWTIWRLCRRERFDIVHAHSSKAGLLARVAAKLAGVPIIIFTAHGFVINRSPRRWVRHVYAQLEALGARLSTKVICVSESDRKTALDYHVGPSDRFVTIWNGVNQATYRPASQEEREVLRVRLHLDPCSVLVGTVARMDSPKDPWTWLEAINRLAPVYSDARFIWVGDGPLLQTVSERVKSIGLADRVLFLGQRNDVSELLRAMDVFVLSSLHEGLPISIAEAMATGLPTVAPNTGGIPEQVTSGVNGYLYEPGNATDLTQKLGRLLAEERIRTRFGTQALLRTRHNFEEARMVNRTVEVYEACCEARGSKGEGHDSPQFSVESVGGSR